MGGAGCPSGIAVLAFKFAAQQAQAAPAAELSVAGPGFRGRRQGEFKMRGFRLSVAAAGSAMLAACATGPRDYPLPPLPPGPVQIAAPAYLFTGVVGDRHDRARKMIAAGARALAPGAV